MADDVRYNLRSTILGAMSLRGSSSVKAI